VSPFHPEGVMATKRRVCSPGTTCWPARRRVLGDPSPGSERMHDRQGYPHIYLLDGDCDAGPSVPSARRPTAPPRCLARERDGYLVALDAVA
jgi:hypothetical protein